MTSDSRGLDSATDSRGTVQSYGRSSGPPGHRFSRDVWFSLTAVAVWVATLTGERWSGLRHLFVPSLVVFVILVVVAMVRQRMSRRALVSVLLVLGAVGGARAWTDGRDVDFGRCEGIATLRTDPSPVGRGTSVVLELGGVRWKAVAFGPPSWRLESRLAGERVRVSGDCGPLTGAYMRRDKVAHIIGKISVDAVSEQFDEGPALVRSVNRLRRAMVRGVADMPDDLRALFTGLVIGDDRNQSRSMVNDFRASGLSHLCAVSGQNVAYLMAVVSPLSRRLRRVARWILTMALLGWFVVLTRAEPSVLRAAFMGGAVATNAAMGIRMNARSVLSITVIGLLVIDPMLAWSVGFALSVGATAGLAWISSGLGRLVGGRGVVAATLSAQLGTMPVSLCVFGRVPVIALVANPLTIATAGVVMMIGLPLALVAGLHPLATQLVSLVFTIPVGWIAGVAHVSAVIGPSGVVNVIGWCCLAVWLLNRWRHRGRSTRDVAG